MMYVSIRFAVPCIHEKRLLIRITRCWLGRAIRSTLILSPLQPEYGKNAMILAMLFHYILMRIKS